MEQLDGGRHRLGALAIVRMEAGGEKRQGGSNALSFSLQRVVEELGEKRGLVVHHVAQGSLDTFETLQDRGVDVRERVAR